MNNEIVNQTSLKFRVLYSDDGTKGEPSPENMGPIYSPQTRRCSRWPCWSVLLGKFIIHCSRRRCWAFRWEKSYFIWYSLVFISHIYDFMFAESVAPDGATVSWKLTSNKWKHFGQGHPEQLRLCGVANPWRITGSWSNEVKFHKRIFPLTGLERFFHRTGSQTWAHMYCSVVTANCVQLLNENKILRVWKQNLSWNWFKFMTTFP